MRPKILLRCFAGVIILVGTAMAFRAIPTAAGVVPHDVDAPHRKLLPNHLGGHIPPRLALTFDDGPNGAATRAIVDILVAKHVPAMFFEVGRSIAADPETTRYVVDHGFPVENHTWDHSWKIPTMTNVELQQELSSTSAIIEHVTGHRPSFMRWPHGLHNHQTDVIARALGLDPVYWYDDPQDYNTQDPNLLLKRTVARARDGAIILLHDNMQDGQFAVQFHDRLGTIAALPRIIDDLRGRGYVFHSVQYLIGLKRGYEF